MRFYNPELLGLYFAIPILFIVLYLIGKYKNRLAGRLGKAEAITKLFSRVNRNASKIALILFFLGLMLTIAALARPQYPGGVEKIETKGGKVVIALDVSLSMLAQDFQPNRLEKARREIIDLLNKLNAQSVGLVIFAGEAIVQCPPTVDYSAFRLFLDVADVGMISDTGTDLASAIEVSAALLDDDSPVDKAVIIFTDGETFDSDAISSAEEAAKKGIRIFTLGVGSIKGRPIPERLGNGTSLKKNKDGEVVLSKLNIEELSAIAQSGNGKFYRATPGETELDEIYAEIKGLKGEEKENRFRILYAEKYKWALLPGVLIILASYLIPLSRRDHDQ